MKKAAELLKTTPKELVQARGGHPEAREGAGEKAEQAAVKAQTGSAARTC